jgi:hypothetical protein
VATNGVVPLAALPNSVVTNGAGGVNISGLFSGGFAGDGSGLTNTASGGVTAGNYVFAYDYPISNGTVTNGYTNAISFSTIANLSGWSCASNTTFTCNQSGLYLVNYYAIAINGGGMGMIAHTPRTGQILSSASYNGGSGRMPLSQSFLAFFNAGDVLQIQAIASAGPMIFAGPYGFSGSDASLTIVRVQ